MTLPPWAAFYRNRRVLLTGHTGFKGAWLAVWLERLGAEVVGLALPPEPDTLGSHAARAVAASRLGDLRDAAFVADVFAQHRPEVVLHLAAQAFVRRSYRDPLETFGTNVLGTAHVLEAARRTDSVRSVVVVTTDKVYENREWSWGYREIDGLGGHDPYSASKACAELVSASYRRSFPGGPPIATARAGNVIGGGDWGEERLVPDLFRALREGRPLELRNPGSVRPWQHVLEPLRGYLILGERLAAGAPVADAWNFGPRDDDIVPVATLVERLRAAWGGGEVRVAPDAALHEARLLRLDWSRARTELGWLPWLRLDDTVRLTVEGYRAGADLPDVVGAQIDAYQAAGAA